MDEAFQQIALRLLLQAGDMDDGSNNNNNTAEIFNATNTTTNVTGAGDDGEDSPTSKPETHEQRDVYEFVAFLCWYLFLVLCCVVPTACAYRRRRLNNRRLMTASRQQRQENGIVFLRGSTMDGRQITIVASQGDGRRILAQQEERLLQERATRIEHAIQKSTMTVTEKDLLKKGEEDPTAVASCNNTKSESIHSISLDEETGAGASDVLASAMSLSLDEESENVILQLPCADENDGGGVPNASRTVPAACAICLCPYEKDDVITWSPKQECKHAFHKECIVPWLSKKEDPLCPCCRQEFCDLDAADTMATSTTTTTPSNSNMVLDFPRSPDDVIIDAGGYESALDEIGHTQNI